MDVRCDKCQARYRIDDARVGAAGLTMKCGKCGNTFKVTRQSALATSAPPPKPAPARPAGSPPSGSGFAASRPAPKAASASAHVDDEAEDNPGGTMVFGGQLVAVKPQPKSAPATTPPKPSPAASRPAPRPVPKPAPGVGVGSTLVFGASPIMAAAPAPAPAPPPAPPPVSGTMIFGSAPPGKPAPAAEAPKPAPAAGPVAPVQPQNKVEAEPGRAAEVASAGPEAAAEAGAAPETAEPAQAAPEPVSAAAGEAQAEGGEVPGGEQAVQAEGGEAAGGAEAAEDAGGAEGGEAVEGAEAAPEAEGAEVAPAQAEVGRGPPKSLVIAVFALAAVLLLTLVGILLIKKLGNQPPSTDSVEQLEAARAQLDKDTLPALESAASSTLQAILGSPRSTFGQARALQSQIEIAWSDALNDQANQLEKKAADAQDDAKTKDAQTAADKARAAAKPHAKAGLDIALAAIKLEPKSPDLAVALADAYRAKGERNNVAKWVKKATDLQADPGQVALVEGLQWLAQDDGADKALPKLEQAAKASPGSARAQYHYSQALQLLKKDAEEQKALQLTLKLSDNKHERARLRLDAIVAAQKAAAAANEAPDAGTPKPK
jgi:predicted Zn finger-like uncharacterized protein